MKVLLVEDSPTTRVMLTYALRKRGHDVTACADGESAWEASQRETFPLIVLDWILPGAVDGLELCRRIRELPHGDRSVILVATAREGTDTLEAVLDAGANDYLAKTDPPASIQVRLAVAERQAADVARRVEAEAARRESVDLFQTAFNKAPIGMALVGLDGRWLQVNDALLRMLGHSADELLATTFDALASPEDQPICRAHSQQLLSGQGESHEWEMRYARKDGGMAWVAVSMALVRDRRGAPAYFVVQIIDVSERKSIEERLARQAFHDLLTGLPNRALFMDRLKQSFARRDRSPGSQAVLFMDLDGFKAVNDTLGHAAGDALLVVVAQRLAACLRAGDTGARLGGDEFTILLDELHSREDALAVAQRILDAVGQPVPIDGREAHVSASIGIAFADGRHLRPADLVHEADQALYRAKSAGKSRYVVAEQSDQGAG